MLYLKRLAYKKPNCKKPNKNLDDAEDTPLDDTYT